MSRRSVFLLITGFTPVFFFLLVEGILRLFNYGGNLDLVTRTEASGKEFFVINRALGQRYFPRGSPLIPEPSEDRFEVEKTDSTIRVFCLGGSSMAGFPFDFNATASSLFRTALENRFPRRRIEVINVGLAAVGSFVVKDLLKDVLAYKPDLIIVYTGHNEFYGVFGAGSSIAFSSGWMTDAYLTLLRFRTVLFIRNVVGSIFTDRGTADERQTDMMDRMARERGIPYRGELYDVARKTWRSNLVGMAETARGAGVPLMFTLPVSNLSGIPPLGPIPTPGITENDRKNAEQLTTLADSEVAREQFSEAVAGYSEAARLDSLNALVQYRLGSVLVRLGAYDSALVAFEKARDFDGLRFRMSGDFGRDLISLCDSLNIPLARIDTAFAASSPNGIIGNNLMMEHLHPNIDGYALIARSWEQTAASRGLLFSGNDWDHSREVPLVDLARLSGVTDFDRRAGAIRIFVLVHQWPFSRIHQQYIPRDFVDSLALSYVRGELPWQSARYELAARYVTQRRFDHARGEAYAVSRVIPDSYEPLLRIADYYFMEGKSDQAISAYEHCLNVERNPYAHAKLGLLFVKEEDFREAVVHLRQAFAVQDSTPYRMPAEISASSKFLLGYSLIRLGKIDEGKEYLKEALSINPRLDDARQLLKSLGG